MAGARRAVLLDRLQQVDAAAVRQLHIEQVGVGALRVGMPARTPPRDLQTFTA